MKAIRKIIIEDFQSHRYTEIEWVDGFNVVVGPSDQGKTAILRAIRWVLFNEPKGTDFVRVGATKAKVTLIMNDGTMVIRERSTSRNRYIVAIPDREEQVYEGFGSSVPEEVMEATGVRPMQLDEDHVVPIHLGMQLDPPFLLDSNGAIKAKAIGRMNGVHILDYAHKMTSSELASKQAEERKIETEILRIDDQLEQFKDLEDWAGRLEKVDQGLSSLAIIEDRIDWLQSQLEVKKDLTKKLIIARDYLDQLSGIDQAAKLLRFADERIVLLERLEVLSQRWSDTKRDVVHCEGMIRKTEGLLSTEVLMRKLDNLWEKEQQAKKIEGQRQILTADLQKLNATLSKTEGLRAAEESLVRFSENVIQYDQLLLYDQKTKELEVQKRKVDSFLERTQGLPQADSLLQDLLIEEQRLERLSILNIRFRDHVVNKQKVEAFTERTSLITIAEIKCGEAQNVDSTLDQLVQLRQRIISLEAEKRTTQEEVVKWEQKIESLAGEYSQQLKEMGRCPICLGEITPVAIERMMEEIV